MAEAPTHDLPTAPDPAAAKAALDRKSEVSEGEAPDDPMGKVEFTFDIDWVHPRSKKRFSGLFTNKILTLQDQVSVGNLRSVLTNSLPVDSLDGETATLSMAQAHMGYSLVVKPKWFDPTQLHSAQLLYMVYDKVLEHEKFFRGPPQAPKASQGGSQ